MFIAGGWKCKSRYREWFERELEKLESKCCDYRNTLCNDVNLDKMTESWSKRELLK